MSDKELNKKRKEEGDVHKGLPEAAPSAGNAYEEDSVVNFLNCPPSTWTRAL